MVDKQKVEQAIRLLLEGIGEDTEREGLKDTPDRIARMCMEIYGGLDEEADQHLAKQFEVENNELVDSRNLPSQEHLCGSQANFLRQIEVRVLICGTISERDIEIMNKAGITVVTGASGRALKAADAYLHDGLPSCAVCTA